MQDHTVAPVAVPSTPVLGVEEWLSWVALAVRLDGRYISKATAEHEDYENGSVNTETTTRKAERFRRDPRRLYLAYQPTEDDRALAAKVIRYINTLPADMSATFAFLRKATERGEIADTPEERGKLAGAVDGYLREEAAVQRIRERGPRKESQYQGEIGESIHFNYKAIASEGLQLIAIAKVGETKNYRHVFQDDKGNRYEWTDNPIPMLLPGEFYRGYAAVKAHREIRKVKTTILTRCTLTPLSH